MGLPDSFRPLFVSVTMRIVLLTVFLFGPLVHGKPLNNQSLVNSFLIRFIALKYYIFTDKTESYMVSECARLFHKIIVFEYFLVADKKKT